MVLFFVFPGAVGGEGGDEDDKEKEEEAERERQEAIREADHPVDDTKNGNPSPRQPEIDKTNGVVQEIFPINGTSVNRLHNVFVIKVC